MILNLCILVALAVPLLLVGAAWRRDHKEKITSVFLALSTALALAASVHDVKWALLGPDYSNRLYATIGINMAIAVILGLYLGITRRWVAALAAIILALDWLYMGAINSVV
jgi:hypothetical protein